jgi:branched-chain amino acid aminotransferase
MTSTEAAPSVAVAVNPFGTPCALVNVDGEIVDTRRAAVDVHAHAVSYGTGTFEGIRAFWNAEHEQLYLSEAVAHYERLHRSARILGLPLRFPAGELVEMTKELLRANEIRAHAYVRPILLQSGAVLSVRMHDVQVRLSIAITPLPGDYIAPDGVRCMVSTWRRTPDTSMPNRAKVIGSYVGPALAKTEAVRAGYDEALMLTGDGHVAEATTANLMLRFGDEWTTPPGTDDILEGITRAQLMTLILERTGRPVRERRIHRSELYVADEALLCGTAATVAPVVSVDGRLVGDGAVGEATQALREQLWAIGRRAHPRHHDWTTPVYPKD